MGLSLGMEIEGWPPKGLYRKEFQSNVYSSQTAGMQTAGEKAFSGTGYAASPEASGRTTSKRPYRSGTCCFS